MKNMSRDTQVRMLVSLLRYSS